jgi:1-deoxy-D-xylulose-5-phosphate reductoisomerase
MASNIAILGSTGSIGVQTLEAAQNLGIRVSALTANKNIDLLAEQAKAFRPLMVSIAEQGLAPELEKRLSGTGIEVYCGADGMKAAVEVEGVDTVVTSIVGIAGLVPTVHAIRKGRNIALANKETFVTAGDIVMS